MFKTLRVFKWITLSLTMLTIAFVICALFLFPDNFRVLLGMAIPTTILLMLILSFVVLVTRKAKQRLLSTNEILNIDAANAFTFGRIGLLIVDENEDLMWINELLDNRGFSSHIGKKVSDIHYKLSELSSETKEIQLNIKSKTYDVKFFPESKTYILRDNTQYMNLLQTYNDDSKVISLINIDNYASLMNSREESFTIRLSNIVKTELTNWATKYNSFLKSHTADGYIMITNQSDFIAMKKDKFDILKRTKEKCLEINADVTLSIGSSFGKSDSNVVSELALEAMELALSRGGDQAIIKAFGEDTEFFGGGTEAKHAKSKVGVRVLTRTLRELMTKHEKVVVMGHEYGDFDAVGSGMAIVYLAKEFGKEAQQVIDYKKVNSKTRKQLREYVDKDYVDKHVISPEQARERVDEKTLVIVVDTNIKDRTECPTIIDTAAEVMVIDHHRSGDNVIDTNNKYIQAGASSVAEILTEVMFYSNIIFKDIPEYISNMLLTGIVMDTNGYRMKTTERTFESSSLLKQWGAEPQVADEFLKDTQEEFKVKSDIFTSMREIIPGIVILNGMDKSPVEQSILAQVAQDATTISGVMAAFAVGYVDDKKIAISGRSTGDANVQTICEKFGGGGHFSAAGAQVRNSTLGEVLVDLEDELKLESWKVKEKDRREV